jgi:hypothetical protein
MRWASILVGDDTEELSDFALPCGVTQGLYWPAAIFRKAGIRACRKA